MRLFKIALAVSAVSAGDKYQATEKERKCLQDCKQSTNCQGQKISKGAVPECIQTCREQCTSDRKQAIDMVFARSSSKLHKVAQRKKINSEKRAEHREMVKNAQPPPMIKEIHEIRDKHNDQIAELFLSCLKHQKDDLGCSGHGPGQAWDCKREMVGNCLDENEGFVGMGSHKIVMLGRRFKESEAKAEETKSRLIALQSMANDVSMADQVEEVKEDVMEKIQTNKHGKIRVGHFRDAMNEKAEQKAERKNDTSDIGLDAVQDLTYQGEAEEQADAEAEEREVEAEETFNFDEVEEAEDAEFEFVEDAEEFSFNNFDGGDFSFDAFDEFPSEGEMANDFTGAEEAEEAEFEEVEEEAEEAPKKKEEKKPLFKLQASNSNKKDKPKKADNNLKVHHGIKNLDKGKHILTVKMEAVEGETKAVEAELEASFTAREVLDSVIAEEAKGEGVTESTLAERGIPKRVVQGTLHATNAGYIQLENLSEQSYIREMCTCRTSMEHYRIKNYLAKWKPSGEKWSHKEDTCKWCAYPNSKKCWQCQQHWQRASDNADNLDDQIRNEQIEMACLLYVRSVRSGKYKAMNSKANDPCKMSHVHDGQYNAWHSSGKMADLFVQYHKVKNVNGK